MKLILKIIRQKIIFNKETHEREIEIIGETPSGMRFIRIYRKSDICNIPGNDLNNIIVGTKIKISKRTAEVLM